MYNTLVLALGLVVLALLLVHFRPRIELPTEEGFSTAAAVNRSVMPECVTRSTDAQSLLARIAAYPLEQENAAELRQLVSKLCCMEADIAAPSAGVYRTMNFQFRTSEDMEPASTIVGRCLRNAVNKRDIELIIEKFQARGHVLIKSLCVGEDVNAGLKELDTVVARLQFAMTSFCLGKQPSMDRPVGARDMGFWEPEEVADLSQYQGISAVPK
jgi:hypothetical protein